MAEGNGGTFDLLNAIKAFADALKSVIDGNERRDQAIEELRRQVASLHRRMKEIEGGRK